VELEARLRTIAEALPEGAAGGIRELPQGACLQTARERDASNHATRPGISDQIPSQ
jgi:hypothetical protein